MSRREPKAATACPAKEIDHWTAAVIIMLIAKYSARQRFSPEVHDGGNPSSQSLGVNA